MLIYDVSQLTGIINYLFVLSLKLIDAADKLVHLRFEILSVVLFDLSAQVGNIVFHLSNVIILSVIHVSLPIYFTFYSKNRPF